MVSLSTRQQTPTVVVSGNQDDLDLLRVQLRDVCTFKSCRSTAQARRLLSTHFVAAWFVDARELEAIEALKQQGQFVVVIDNQYCEQNEMAAYQAGAMYVCGPLETEWVQALLGLPSAIEEQAHCALTIAP